MRNLPTLETSIKAIRKRVFSIVFWRTIAFVLPFAGHDFSVAFFLLASSFTYDSLQFYFCGPGKEREKRKP